MESNNSDDLKQIQTNFSGLSSNQQKALFLEWTEKGGLDILKLMADNSKTMDKESLLLLACQKGHLEIVKYLVSTCKCDIENSDIFKNTALFYACEKGSLEIVQFLISNGSKVNSKNAKGESPLHFAARSTSKHGLEIVKLLITHNVDKNSEFHNGRSPLMEASIYGNLDVVKYFIEKSKYDPNQLNFDQRDCLSLASGSGKLEVVNYLIPFSIRDHVDKNCRTALHWGCLSGNLDVVKLLISKNSNVHLVDKFGLTPLMIASKQQNLELVKYFILDLKCDPNRTTYPVHNEGDRESAVSITIPQNHGEVITQNHSKVIDILISFNITVTLLEAATNGHLYIFQFLCDFKKMSFDVSNEDGWTPLMIASSMGNLELVKYFLSIGVKKDCSDNSGDNSLHWATKNGHSEIVKLLLSKGLDANSSNNAGWTPLMIASSYGKLEIVNILVSANCDPNQTNKEFRTCFHLAALNNHLELVKYLFSMGCNPIARDKDHRMALDLATQNGHVHVSNFLKQLPQQYYPEMRLATLNSISQLLSQIQQLEIQLKEKEDDHNQKLKHQIEVNHTAINTQAARHLEELKILRDSHSKELKAKISLEQDQCKVKLLELAKQNEEKLSSQLLEFQTTLSELKSNSESKYLKDLKSKDSEIGKLRQELSNEKMTKSFQYQKQIEDLEQQLKFESSKQQSTTQNIHTLDCEKDLVFGITLGSGSFAKVLKSKMGIQDVAVKTIKIEDIDPNEFPKIKASFEKELEILNRARHPNIVNVVGVCRNIDHLSFILELAERGSLYRYLHQTKGFKFSEEQTIRILIDISNGMNYLHQFKPQIIHRDLKSDNILLFSDWTAKVTDFGLSKLKEASSRSKTNRTGMVGTVNWMAPEMMDPNLPKTTDRVDVYSFGMVIFEMLSWDEEDQTHLKPWNGINSAFISNSVIQGRRPADPVPKKADPKKKDKVSGDLIFKSLLSLMKNCWVQNAHERPSFSIIVAELEKMENGVMNVFVDWKLSPDLLLIEGWKSPPNISKSRTLPIKPLPAPTTPKNNRNVLNVIQNSIVLENEKLASLLEKLHNTKSFTINQAHVIDNSTSQNSFESRIDYLNRKILERPSIFGPKPGSPHSPNDQFRQKILSRLDLYAEQWLHNQNKGNLQFIPMFHALQDEKSGWSIAGTGFSNLQIIDKGYFGSGIYFTSNLEYACKYVETPIQLEGGKKGYWVMLSWVLIGNALPVVELETYRGKPLEGGYDAHWTLVKPQKGEGGFVIPGSFVPVKANEPELLNENLTELVVNQESQCLPMYLLFVVK